MENIQYQMKTIVGRLYVVASAHGLQGVFFNKQPGALVKKIDGAEPAQKILSRTVEQLEEYLNGQRKQFDVVYDLQGTAFQKQVWRQLAKIPFGKTVSYRDIAKRISNPKAVRAVGSANGKNPLCIIIPCHRVIAADGTIGGYSGGIGIKKKLLQLEEIKL